MLESILQIPSHLFVPLVYQIASRINKVGLATRGLRAVLALTGSVYPLLCEPLQDAGEGVSEPEKLFRKTVYKARSG